MGLLVGNSFYESRLVILRFCKGKEELRGAAVYWAFLLWVKVLVQWCQDLWMLWEIGNSYGSNGKALESSARRSFLWRIYGYLLRVRQVLPYGLIQGRKIGEEQFWMFF